MEITPLERIFCFTLTLTSSFLKYIFVGGPLGGPKRVLGNIFEHTDSIGCLEKNICILTKNGLFSKK